MILKKVYKQGLGFFCMIIKKIFEEGCDEEVHSDFLKFGRGEYKDKYLTDCKKQKDKWAVKTGYEFANFLVRRCLEGVEGELQMSGCIVSTFDLSGEVKFNIDKVKNFMGVRQIVLNTNVKPGEIIALMNKYPRVFFALSFSTNNCILKIKQKAPKSAKPSTKEGGEVKADFCSLKTSNKAIIDELFFDRQDFNEIKVRHTLKINDVIYPKDEKDPKEIREKSQKKGIVVRNMEVDGQKTVSEKEFIA